MPSQIIPIPNPGPTSVGYQFTVMPANGTTPAKLIIKSTTGMWIWNDQTNVLTQVTDANYPATTVYGVAQLDGTIYVMQANGQINGSNLLDPTTWNALNFITANSEGDGGVALTRHLTYIYAFKQRSTQVFYDAGNAAPGSPLASYTSALMEVGCATAGSIAYSDNTIYFMSDSYPKGRSITKLDGFTPTYVSDPYIDRLLNADDLANVFSFVVKSNGHIFYVLTLTTTKITLVYDEVTQKWHRWTYLAPSPSIVYSASVDLVNNLVIYTTNTAHMLSDGDPVSISGVGVAVATVTGNNTFTIPLMTHFTVTGQVCQMPPTAGTLFGYSETYFPSVYYTRGSNVDYLFDQATGNISTFDTTTYQDNGNPINCKARTSIEDLGTMSLKMIRKLEWVGDFSIQTTVFVRWSDDDYTTWGQFRSIVVTQKRAQLGLAGATRRRAHELRHIDNTPLRGLAIELTYDEGSR